MTLKQIDEELRSIVANLESDQEMTEEEITQSEERAEELRNLRNELVQKAEKRAATLEAVKNGAGNVVETFEERKVEDNMNAEYRSAYFKRLLGRELTESEERAYTTSNAAGAIPTESADEVIKKITKLAPVLDEITLLKVRGNITFAVEGTKTKGAVHTENGAITPDSDTLVSVTLGGYEVTKLIQVSDAVSTMSIDEFEDWLTDMIAEMVATKIEDLVFNGTGTNEATGVDKANTWGATNSVTVAKTASLTADNVRALIALLPAGYDNGAKFYMNKKTLFNSVMGLQDNAKHDLVKEIDGKHFIYGYEVKTTDAIAENVAYLGNFKKYVGNFNKEIQVKKDFDMYKNSNLYLGVCIFDGKPAIGEAFVKLDKATS